MNAHVSIVRSGAKQMENEDLITFTADIVSAYVANNRIAAEDVGKLVEDVHQALSSVGQQQANEEAPEPVVSVRSSVKKDHLVCLACGKKMKMLKRHLGTEHDMTPQEYRDTYNLSQDYPLVAPDYAEKRRDLAVKIGLGRKPGQKRGRQPATKATKNGNGGK